MSLWPKAERRLTLMMLHEEIVIRTSLSISTSFKLPRNLFFSFPQFSPRGTLCRKSSGECDVEEVCSGRSAEVRLNCSLEVGMRLWQGDLSNFTSCIKKWHQLYW